MPDTLRERVEEDIRIWSGRVVPPSLMSRIMQAVEEELAALKDEANDERSACEAAVRQWNASEAREAKLAEALDSLLSAIEDWHGSQRGEYCDEMCDRLHMAMDKADEALAKERYPIP